jgi:hypothetical protein
MCKNAISIFLFVLIFCCFIACNNEQQEVEALTNGEVTSESPTVNSQQVSNGQLSSSQQESNSSPRGKPAQANSAGTEAKTQRRFQKVAVIDTTGFGKPIPAVSVMIPAGWKTNGGVVWQVNQSGCGRHNPHFAWSAVAPDGESIVSILPEETWGGNNLNVPHQSNCPNLWIENIENYLRTWVQHSRPQAQIRTIRPRVDIAQQYQNLNRRDAFPGGELRTWVEAGEVLLDYQIGDQAYEEIVALCVVFSLNSMQGVMPGEIRRFLTMSSMPGFSMRTPRGELDMRMAETIRTSGRPNPQWVSLMQQHNSKMAAINRKGAADRHRIRMETNREIAAMNQKSFENRQKVMDEGVRKFNQTTRGVEDFVDPTTKETFELESGFNNAWRLKDDTYILTDDYNFEPYRDLGIEGQQLEAGQ